MYMGVESMKRPFKNGEPTTYADSTITHIGCCDCGLSHLVLYNIKDKKVTVEYYRDDWDTRLGREEMSEDQVKWLIKLFQKELRRRKK